MNKTDQCSCQGCGCGNKPKNESTNQNKLIISWQRLVSDGSTCPRCGSTEDQLDMAVLKLKEVLKPKGIEVVLEKKELTIEEFKQNPLSSNKILFNGRSLEELLNAESGHSKCCDVCGDEDCRTVEFDGTSHEMIPVELIVKAGIKAVA